MYINELIKKQNVTKYRLSKESGVPYATINDICNEKVSVEKCSAATIYKLSKTLGVSMEALVEDSMKIAKTVEYRSSFETFKSNICHRVHDMGDLDFIINVLETDDIRKYYSKKWYAECLYLLAMVDYLSRENDLPICTKYNDIRVAKLHEPIYPSSVLVMSAATKNEHWKTDSYRAAIPEFKRFNIIESEVRNVF